MAKKKSLLDQMRSNPRADWKIKDIEKLCSQTGLSFEPPSHGSHFKVFSQHLRDALTIPARRPIKPPYIRNLVSYADAHSLASEKGNQTDD
jgi:hypothetical protein